MARSTLNRYVVTGPGVDPEPSYTDAGPALSRSLTFASASALPDGTWYVRDAVTDAIIGYSERGTTEAGVTIKTSRSHR